MKITVVGAGIVGCAIAHELACRGARVEVIDSRGVGRGATRASAGILAPQIEGHLPELRSLTTRSLAMYDEFVRRVESDSRRSVEYSRSGTLQVALDDAESYVLASDAKSLNAAGVECSLMKGDVAKRMEPELSADIRAALHVPIHGFVGAAPLTEALADAARARGVRVSTSAVLAIDAQSRTPRVTTEDGVVESDAVIVASGSWPVRSRPADPPHVKPIRGQLLKLRCEEPVALRVIWGQACYVVPWSDGTVLVGATVEDVGFDERPTVEGVRKLISAGIALLPSIEGAHFEEVRVGFRPKTGDELPIIGPSDSMPGVFYALGHYRNGVLLAPLTASLMADLVLDRNERPELALVRPGRLTQA